jgi:hypothetical protein
LLRQVQALLGERANMVAFVAADLSRFLLELGRAPEAEAMAALALSIAMRDAQAQSCTVAAAHWAHGRTLLALHRQREARQALERARGYMVRERGAEHPLALDIAASHASALAGLGRLVENQQALDARMAAFRAGRPVGRGAACRAASRIVEAMRP